MAERSNKRSNHVNKLNIPREKTWDPLTNLRPIATEEEFVRNIKDYIVAGLTDQEIEKLIKNSSAFGPMRIRGSSHCQKILGDPKQSLLQEIKRIRNTFKDTLIEKTSTNKDEVFKLKLIFQGNAKEGIEVIANFLIKKYSLKTIKGKKRDEIYVFNGKIYVEEGEEIIRKEAEKILEENCSTHLANEIIEKTKRLTFIKRKDLENEDLNLICLNNGVLNFKTGELMPHGPDHVFLTVTPIDYDPKADCPKIKKFLKTTFYKEDVPVIEEWFGYALWREYPVKKGLILWGEDPHGGRTTLLKLLVAFVGEENASEIALQKIAVDKFASAELYKRHVNFYDDLSPEDLRNPGKLKMATGGGWIDGEYKFGAKFKFMNFAKLTFATNQIPLIKHEDDAYYSRWIIIKCDQIFDENNPKTDLHLIKKITTKKELSGLLNLALRGLKRLLKRGKFSYNLPLDEVKAIMQRSGSVLAAFVQDEVIRKDGNFISKEVLFERYSKYTLRKDKERMSEAKVGRHLPNFANYVIDGKGTVTIEGKKRRVRGWWNVAFKNEDKFKKGDNETSIKKLP